MSGAFKGLCLKQGLLIVEGIAMVGLWWWCGEDGVKPYIGGRMFKTDCPYHKESKVLVQM